MIKDITKYKKYSNTEIGGLWKKKQFKKNNKSNPLISIITITLNSQKFLKFTLDSIFNQKYKNYELIIIDGGSKDKTLKIIKQNEKRIDFWLSEKDKGIYDAFNKGMELARGELIGFVNSDDILNNDALYTLVKYHKKFPQMDFFFGSVKKHWGILHGYNRWKIYYTWNFYSGHSLGFFIKKNAAKKIGKYNLEYKYHADWDYMYRMIVHHNMKGVATKKNEVFGNFRRGGFSSKIDFWEHFKETILIRKNNGQQKLIIFLISIIKYFYNKNRLKQKNLISIIFKKIFFE
jgi:glycosyltransferase involved in cell wall biosynthesis